jgi:hypothetical protein
MSSLNDFDNLDLIVSCMTISEKFFSLKLEDQHIFIDYIMSEYNIDDEFTNLVNAIINSFNCKSQSSMEYYLDNLCKFYDEKNILMVINSMLDYLNEMIEYIEYQ